MATVKGRDELWRETGSEQPFTDVEMVDEIALVPIEAEEENALRDFIRPETGRIAEAAFTRLVTPWEEA